MALELIAKEKQKRIACLVIGASGIGKTCLLRTLLGQEYNGNSWDQKTSVDWNICVLSAESGLLSVSNILDRIEGFKIKNQSDMRQAYQLLAHNKEYNKRYKNGWIFIDSLTEISQQVEEQSGKDVPEESKAFKRWTQYTSDMTKIIKYFRDLIQYNVVFTCLIRTKIITQGGMERKIITPDISGQALKDRLVSFFDEVFYYDFFKNEEGEQRGLLTETWQWRNAKDRSGKLDKLEEPNLLKIYNKIIGE